MTASRPSEARSNGRRRRLRSRPDHDAVVDGQARFVAERPQPADPVVFLYELYERTAVPFGLACVALGVAFAVMGLLMTGLASPRP